MARKTFDPTADYTAPEEAGPVLKTHGCRAHGCPLSGTMDNVCANHWIANTGDWTRVTEALRRMLPLIYEVNRARKVLSDPNGIPGVQLKGHVAAMERIRGYLSEEQLAKFEAKPPYNYGNWLYMLELMITLEVQRVMKLRRTRDDTDHPAYAARVRAAQVPGQAADYIREEGLGV